MNDALPKWRRINGTSPDFSEPLNFMAMAELATGHAAEAEAHVRKMVAVQTGKIDPHDRRFGASHLLWAKALVQQGRFAEALPHARIADKLLAKNAVSPRAKAMMAEAHQVLLTQNQTLPSPVARAPLLEYSLRRPYDKEIALGRIQQIEPDLPLTGVAV